MRCSQILIGPTPLARQFIRVAAYAVVLAVMPVAPAPAAPPEPRSSGTAAWQPIADKLNAQLRQAWRTEKIVPAPEVDDARFLRRVSLDISGRLPTAAEVEKFLADHSADKRTAAVDRLLAGPAYGEHWATYWDNLLIGRLTREAYLDRTGFREWLRKQFDDNRPWNETVRTLITAEGYNTNREPLRGGGPTPADFAERHSPAVNYFLRYSRSLPDFSSSISKNFLGVQIQCAQCHDHKTEKWTQKDFRQFTACFSKTWATYVDKPAMLTTMVGTYRMELKDRMFAPPVARYETYFGSYADYVDPQPKLLDGPELGFFANRRKAAADWVVGRDNPWFARAIVNRIWGRLLGTGFVEPIDDFRPGNPATLPETLSTLADDFTASGYDLKRLIRIICASDAYGRACISLDRAPGKHHLWAAYPIKALEVEELFDAMVAATDVEPLLNRATKNNFALIRNAFISQLVSQMGTDDMAEVTEPEETIPRSLLLLNGALSCGSTRLRAGAGLGDLLDRHSDDGAVIDQLYLRTLSRMPTADERQRWTAFVAKPRAVVHTAGPAATSPTGPAALLPSKEIAEAGKVADFSELLKHAKTAADFTALRGRMENNADAAVYVKAFTAYAAEAPFQLLATSGGGDTPREQAFEDMYWALVNSTEFLTNH
jgi:hypothetical protein